MRGRPPKSPGRAQGHREHPTLTLVPVPAHHPPPPDLLPAVLTEWEAFWESPYAAVVNWDRDHRALWRLFKLYSLRAELEAAAEDENGVLEVLVKGSQNQEILNPALRHIATLDDKILSLEQQFGLTPRSAAGLGLTLGGLRKTLEDRNREANERAARKKA